MSEPQSPPVSGSMLSALDAASNACLKLAANHGFATGHGDTVADMIGEFDAQIGERLSHLSADMEHQAHALRQERDEVQRLSAAVEEMGDMIKARDAQLFVAERIGLNEPEPPPEATSGRVGGS